MGGGCDGGWWRRVIVGSDALHVRVPGYELTVRGRKVLSLGTGQRGWLIDCGVCHTLEKL